MPGFINSPALAKLVALQMLDEERHAQRGRRTRTSLRARLFARRTSPVPAKPRRVSPTTAVVENAN